MKAIKGFTYTELLVCLGIVSTTLLTVSTLWLSSLQDFAKGNQARLAQNILNNIAVQIIANHQQYSAAEISQWQHNVSQILPGAEISVSSHQLKISWPSSKTNMSLQLAF
ncbi:MAG: hypothetical protein K0S08_247 [Gammaproteobacteria bacterium]|jgi:Tfp pilus assembly protein PilV|nr:hypothetical protein [Gammaproteobacteria bacterium]